MNWVTLTNEGQLTDILNSDKPVAIFKHSTRCSISSMAKNRVERLWNFETPIYYLDLIALRGISNKIAEISGVEHESPQLLIFHAGKCVYHASHNMIMSEPLDEYLN